MKKTLSLVLAIIMMLSTCIIPVSATEAGGNWNGGTLVSYDAEDPDGDGIKNNTEAYTVTVPAQLAPGTAGEVVLAGTWASDRIVIVTADEEVVLENSINPNNTKTLVVTFATIEQEGSNTAAIEVKEDVSVAGITNAIFGTWSGTFNYFVDIVTEVAFTPGLYETGAIALYEEHGPEAIEEMRIFTWDELIKDGLLDEDYGVAWGKWDLLDGDLIMPKELQLVTGWDCSYSSCKNLTGVVLPESIKSVLGEEITSLNYGMFSGCSSLSILVINDNVTYLGENLLGDCSALNDIRYSGTAEQWMDIKKYQGAMAWNWGAPDDKVSCVDREVCIDGCYGPTEPTCEQRSVCERCGGEYGQWVICTPENGICTMCNRPATVIETTHYPCIDYAYGILGTWDYSDAQSVDITMTYQTDAYGSDGARIIQGVGHSAGYSAETRTYLTADGELLETNNIDHADVSFNTIKNLCYDYFHDVDMLTGTIIYKSSRADVYGATIVIRPNYAQDAN